MSIIDAARHVRAVITEAALGLVSAVGAPSDTPTIVVDPDGHHAVVLIRDGYNLKRLDGPMAVVPTHTFADLGTFAAYLNRHAADPERCHILLDPQALTVKAGVDPRNTAADLVSCTLQRHPRYVRWAKAFQSPLTQQGMLNLILGAEEDFARLRSDEGDDLGSMARSLAAQLQKFSAGRNIQMKVETDETGAIRFQGLEDKVEVRGKLPPRFVVVVPFLVGVERPDDTSEWVEATYAMEVLMRVDVDDKGPSFCLSCPRLPVLQHEAQRDAAAYLEHKLNDGFLVGLGGFATARVNAPFTG